VLDFLQAREGKKAHLELRRRASSTPAQLRTVRRRQCESHAHDNGRAM
jgi:hypothetical protein